MSRSARPMSDRGRRQAFAAAAGLLAISSIGLAMLGPEPAPEPKPDPQPRQPAVVATPSATPEAAAPSETTAPARAAQPPLDVGQQRAVVASARAFLTAYLRYEVGDDSARVRRALRERATKSFARELLAHPPRVTGTKSSRAGRIDGLELGDTATATRIGVAATIARGKVLTPLGLHLDRTEQGWLVQSIG